MAVTTKKFLVLTFGEQDKVRLMFPKDDGKPMSRRAFYDVLHYISNSELADRIRSYIIKDMGVRPRTLKAE